MLRNTVVFPISQTSIRGTPDILLCVNSMFIALELKTDIGKLSSLQEKCLNDITRAKGVALVARPANWSKTFKVLLEISKENVDLPNGFETTH